MRSFFAGLLVLNIAFAGWYWFFQKPETAPLPRADKGVEMLALVNDKQEAQPAENPAADPDTSVETQSVDSVEPSPVDSAIKVEKPTAAVATAPTRKVRPKRQPAVRPAQASAGSCYNLGLYTQRQEAENRRVTMQALGYNAKLTTKYAKKVIYLVYLPAYPSYTEASKVTEQLKESGQLDYQIQSIKGKKNSISLGVYSQPNTAEIRRQEIAALGLEPLVEPVYGQPMGFNIEFSKNSGLALTEGERDELLQSEENKSIAAIKCSP